MPSAMDHVVSKSDFYTSPDTMTSTSSNSVLEIELNNGIRMPSVALGTWKAEDQEASFAVAYAIKFAGYRHIDCAWSYGNETEIGQGIAASGVPRSELFLTGKVWSTYHSRVEECLDQTLAALGTDYLDLYMIHWPVALNSNGSHQIYPLLKNGKRDVDYAADITETWAQMEELVRKGKVRTIGVSNFSEPNLEKVLATCNIVPAVNQTEIHVFNPEHRLISFMQSKGIVPQAHTPLGASNSPLLDNKTVVKIARKHTLLPSNILLGYLLAKDIPIVAKSVNPDRLSGNMSGGLAAAAKLDERDILELDSIAASGYQRRFFTPPWPVALGFENWPQADISCKLPPRRKNGNVVKISQCPCAFSKR